MIYYKKMALKCVSEEIKKILNINRVACYSTKLSKWYRNTINACKPKAYFQLLIIVNHSCIIITMSKMYLMAHVFDHDTQINIAEWRWRRRAGPEARELAYVRHTWQRRDYPTKPPTGHWIFLCIFSRTRRNTIPGSVSLRGMKHCASSQRISASSFLMAG